MNRLWLLTGRVFYWVTLPALFLFLLPSKRTRVLVWVGTEFLVVKAWHGTGNWQLPGGGLHGGEPSVRGAVRELSEETGIDASESDLVLLQTNVWSNGWLCFRFDVYALTLVAKPAVVLQEGELVDYSWMSRDIPNSKLTADALQSLEIWKSQR